MHCQQPSAAFRFRSEAVREFRNYFSDCFLELQRFRTQSLRQESHRRKLSQCTFGEDWKQEESFLFFPQ
ncbi:zinc-finger domain-containing protein [Ruminococcus bromii]|uniref:zinc-finger domain-containing protein n=1 Tax=Ruminococcus bromii TaxID=40518 RepID=UPI0039B43184